MIVDEEITLIEYIKKSNLSTIQIKIPRMINGLPVTKIANGFYKGKSNIQVYIPSSIILIEENAFVVTDYNTSYIYFESSDATGINSNFYYNEDDRSYTSTKRVYYSVKLDY